MISKAIYVLFLGPLLVLSLPVSQNENAKDASTINFMLQHSSVKKDLQENVDSVEKNMTNEIDHLEYDMLGDSELNDQPRYKRYRRQMQVVTAGSIEPEDEMEMTGSVLTDDENVTSDPRKQTAQNADRIPPYTVEIFNDEITTNEFTESHPELEADVDEASTTNSYDEVTIEGSTVSYPEIEEDIETYTTISDEELATIETTESSSKVEEDVQEFSTVIPDEEITTEETSKSYSGIEEDIQEFSTVIPGEELTTEEISESDPEFQADEAFTTIADEEMTTEETTTSYPAFEAKVNAFTTVSRDEITTQAFTTTNSQFQDSGDEISTKDSTEYNSTKDCETDDSTETVVETTSDNSEVYTDLTDCDETETTTEEEITPKTSDLDVEFKMENVVQTTTTNEFEVTVETFPENSEHSADIEKDTKDEDNIQVVNITSETPDCYTNAEPSKQTPGGYSKIVQEIQNDTPTRPTYPWTMTRHPIPVTERITYIYRPNTRYVGNLQELQNWQNQPRRQVPQSYWVYVPLRKFEKYEEMVHLIRSALRKFRNFVYRQTYNSEGLQRQPRVGIRLGPVGESINRIRNLMGHFQHLVDRNGDTREERRESYMQHRI